VAKSGKDNVDHPLGGSDDHANVLAGVASLVIAKPLLQKVSMTVPFLASRPSPFRNFDNNISSGIDAWSNTGRFSG
jgi:hypothetical protein